MKLRMTMVGLFTFFTLLGGCRLLPIRLPPDPQVVEILSKLRFPEGAPIGDDLDILVIRDGAAFNVVNRTAQAYSGRYLWLNLEYVAHIDHIKIGTDNRFDLSRFINLHRESFPVGAWLAPDKARPLISADLFDPEAGILNRLVVQRSDK